MSRLHAILQKFDLHVKFDMESDYTNIYLYRLSYFGRVSTDYRLLQVWLYKISTHCVSAREA